MTTKVKENRIIPILTDQPIVEIPLNNRRGVKYVLVDEPRFAGASIECEVQWHSNGMGFSDCLEEITVKIDYQNLLEHTRQMLKEDSMPTNDDYVEAHFESEKKAVIESYLETSNDWTYEN